MRETKEKKEEKREFRVVFRVGIGGTLMKNERTKGVFTENVCMSCIVVLVTEL